MKKLVIFLLAIALMPSLQFCKKKEEPKPSAEEIISMDDWTFYKAEFYDANGNLLGTSYENNKVVFTPSGDFYFYDSSGNIADYGTWELIDNDAKIKIFTHSGTTWIFEIEKLTDNEFDYSDSGGSGKQIYYHKR